MGLNEKIFINMEARDTFKEDIELAMKLLSKHGGLTWQVNTINCFYLSQTKKKIFTFKLTTKDN